MKILKHMKGHISGGTYTKFQTFELFWASVDIFSFILAVNNSSLCDSNAHLVLVLHWVQSLCWASSATLCGGQTGDPDWQIQAHLSYSLTHWSAVQSLWIQLMATALLTPTYKSGLSQLLTLLWLNSCKLKKVSLEVLPGSMASITTANSLFATHASICVLKPRD